jgi:hypothetical protein
MSASTPIATLVQSMLADGVEHSAIVHAVEAAEIGLRKETRRGPARRGGHLPADWWPTPDLLAYAQGQGMSADHAAREAEKFRNYWSARSGAGAVKRDWDATWRNWILKAMEDRHGTAVDSRRAGGRHPAAGHPPTGANAVLAGMGRLAHRLAEGRSAAGSEHRRVAGSADAPTEHDFDKRGT